MDKRTGKFNPEAMVHLSTIKGAKEKAKEILFKTLELAQAQKEVNTQLKVVQAEMRRLTEEAEKQLQTKKQEILSIVENTTKIHSDCIDKMRKAQPELEEFEFDINFEKGEYTETAKREKEEKNQTESMPVLDDVMARMMRKE